jgi:hypothetical protein
MQSVENDGFGISLRERKATIYEDGNPFNTTTMAQAGKAIAKFLELPEEQIDKNFTNGFVFISSFHLAQPELFQTVLRATNTTEAGWKIGRKPVDSLLQSGRKAVKEGVPWSLNLVYGLLLIDGDYQRKLHNDLLGLEADESLEEVFKAGEKVLARCDLAKHGLVFYKTSR